MQQDRRNSLQTLCLIEPGHLVVGDDPSVIFAVCGAGLVISLFNPVHAIGGLAYCFFNAPRNDDQPTLFYSDVAIPALAFRLLKDNQSSHDLQAHLIGASGQTFFARIRAWWFVFHAQQSLKKLGIRVVSKDVGGTLGRKMLFHTANGGLFIQKTAKVRRSDWCLDKGVGQYYAD